MKNTRRRKRRANPSRTRSQRGKRTVQALAAGAVIAAGTQAYADPIRFDNPAGEGHFDWADGAEVDYVWLDMTLPAGDQPGTEGPSTLGQRTFETIGRLSGAVKTEVGGYGDYYAIGVDAGELIPTGAPFAGSADIYYAGYSELPEGTVTYLGNRLDLGYGFQYGWIGVVRTGRVLDTFAWGYETDPGVPIEAGAIPEPGTLAMLALGATALLGRRRRRSQID